LNFSLIFLFSDLKNVDIFVPLQKSPKVIRGCKNVWILCFIPMCKKWSSSSPSSSYHRLGILIFTS
jgi:hypothetical protein